MPVGVIACDVIPMSAVPPPLRPPRDAKRGRQVRLNAMFDKTIILVLSGLVAASVVARCSLERRVAVWMQRALGKRPRLFLLVLMQMGLLLSMCISNVTAPILLLSVVTLCCTSSVPCSYSRALLLGLAFSCNLGGMPTPISSPQNAVALEARGRRARDLVRRVARPCTSTRRVSHLRAMASATTAPTARRTSCRRSTSAPRRSSGRRR